jgi:hypothetical protein
VPFVLTSGKDAQAAVKKTPRSNRANPNRSGAFFWSQKTQQSISKVPIDSGKGTAPVSKVIRRLGQREPALAAEGGGNSLTFLEQKRPAGRCLGSFAPFPRQDNPPFFLPCKFQFFLTLYTLITFLCVIKLCTLANTCSSTI